MAPLFKKNYGAARMLNDFHDETDDSGANLDFSFSRAMWARGYNDDGEEWESVGVNDEQLTPAGSATCGIPQCRCDWRYHFVCLGAFNDTWWPGSEGLTTIAMDGADTDEGSFSRGFDETWFGARGNGDGFIGLTRFPKALGRRVWSQT